MMYINGLWFRGNCQVNNADTVLHRDCSEVLTHLYNWPDTNDLGVAIELTDDEHFKVSGPINNMLLFIYNQVLGIHYTTINEVIKDRDLELNIDTYFRKVW